MRKVFTDLVISSRSQLGHVRPADPRPAGRTSPPLSSVPAARCPGQDRPPVLRVRGYQAQPSPHDGHTSKQSRTGKHQAAMAIGRVRPLAAGTESEDHHERDQYI